MNGQTAVVIAVLLMLPAGVGAQTTAPANSLADLERRLAELEQENQRLRAERRGPATVPSSSATTRATTTATRRPTGGWKDKALPAKAEPPLRELQAACGAYASAKLELEKVVKRAEDDSIIFERMRNVTDQMETVVRTAHDFSAAIGGIEHSPIKLFVVVSSAQTVAGDEKTRDQILEQLEVQRRALNQLRRGEIDTNIYKIQTAMLPWYEHHVDTLTKDVLKAQAEAVLP